MLYKTISIVMSNNSANGNRIDGVNQSNQHITLNLKPATCRFGAGKKIAIFSNDPSFDELSQYFKNVQQEQDGSRIIRAINTDGTPNTNFPVGYEEVDGGVDFTINFPAGVVYARTYTSAVRNSQNQIIHNVGDVVCDEGGNPILLTSMTVFAVRIKDDASDDGWFYPFGKPQDKVAQFLKRGYKRMDTTEPETVTVEMEGDPGIPPIPPIGG